jgi:hypothetical protein
LPPLDVDITLFGFGFGGGVEETLPKLPLSFFEIGTGRDVFFEFFIQKLF